MVRPLILSLLGWTAAVSTSLGQSSMRELRLSRQTCGKALPFARLSTFRAPISPGILASGGQRLRRPVLRKGFAFPATLSDFYPREGCAFPQAAGYRGLRQSIFSKSTRSGSSSAACPHHWRALDQR